MHRAPVVGILVLDGHSVPLPEPLEVAHDLSKSPDMQGSHQLLVVSEEQFKVPHERRRGPRNPRGIQGAQMLGTNDNSQGSLKPVFAFGVRVAAEEQERRGASVWRLWAHPGSVVGSLQQDQSVGGTGNADREMRGPGVLLV